jgi:hypothetical protein
MSKTSCASRRFQNRHRTRLEQHPRDDLHRAARHSHRRKGTEIEKMTEEIGKMSGGKSVKIDIQEIKTPELDAQLVAENVALQMERRISFRAR